MHLFLSVRFCLCTGLLVRISFLFCVRGVFWIFRVQAAVDNCQNCQHCCVFTVVKYVKETCETTHSIPKDVFRGKRRTWLDVHECDLELGKFVEHFHVLSRRCLGRCKGPAVPERDLQKMDGRKIALGNGLSNPWGRTSWNFPHLVQW